MEILQPIISRLMLTWNLIVRYFSYYTNAEEQMKILTSILEEQNTYKEDIQLRLKSEPLLTTQKEQIRRWMASVEKINNEIQPIKKQKVGVKYKSHVNL